MVPFVYGGGGKDQSDSVVVSRLRRSTGEPEWFSKTKVLGFPGNVWNAWHVFPLLSQGIVVEILLRRLHLSGRKRSEEGDAAFWASWGAFVSRPGQFPVGKSAGVKIRNKTYSCAFLERDSHLFTWILCVVGFGHLFYVFSVSLTDLAFSPAALCETEVQNKPTKHSNKIS